MAPVAWLLLPLAFTAVLADIGYYVPKAFYTIDKFGHESPSVLLNGLLRPKRNTIVSSSSSSSSSSNGYGQSQSFSVSGSGGGHVYAQDPYYVAGIAASPPGYVNAYDNSYNTPGFQAVPVLYNRFGDDGVQGVGISGHSNGGNGVFSSSSSVVDPNGKVHYTAHTGKF